MGKENGVELQAQKLAEGFSELSRMMAIFVGEEFEAIIEMEHRIPQDEVAAVAPSGLARGGARKFQKGKPRQNAAIFEPAIGVDFSPRGFRSMKGRAHRVLQGEAVALMVPAGEGDGMDVCHMQ